MPRLIHGRKRERRNIPALSPWSLESMIPKVRVEGRNHLEQLSTPVCMHSTITCIYIAVLLSYFLKILIDVNSPNFVDDHS